MPAGPATIELGDRLFRADVERLDVEAGATRSELGWFCRLLAHWDRRAAREGTIADSLVDGGVAALRVRLTERLEILELPCLTAEHVGPLRAERRTRASRPVAPSGPFDTRVWMRTDPDSDLESLDLVDLAFLVERPLELARLLQASRGDPTDGLEETALLSENLSTLVELYGALDPSVASRRLEELAATFLALDEAARRRLTNEVLLPELFESRRTGPLMAALPDAELVTALRSVSARGIGAPGLVEHVLERADLPAERRAAIREALGPGVKEAGAMSTPPDGDSEALREWLALGGGKAPDDALRELTARDLAVDAATEKALARIRADVAASSPEDERLRACLQLVYHVLNPEVAEEMVRDATSVLSRLLDDERTAERAVVWVARLRTAADSLRPHGPDVAETVDRELRALCSADFVRRAARSWAGGSAADPGGRLITALGAVAATPLLEALDSEPSRAVRRRIVDFMRERAGSLGPGLVARLSDPRWTVVRNAASVLGFAGEGFEPDLTPLLGHEEPRVAREALLAVARIGGEEAARLVVERVRSDDASARELALEALRRFPAAERRRLVRPLLEDPSFYLRRPGVARGLLNRCFDGRVAEPERRVLEALLPLRVRVWRPSQLALGWAAAAALRR
ncbi:MAG: HEAT repeat domain-containing protein [Gemmatimonadota bacterium]